MAFAVTGLPTTDYISKGHPASFEALGDGSDSVRFAASVAGFGQLLKGGTYTGSWDFEDALDLARSSRGVDPHGYRSEFLHLIELAKALSSGS